MENQVYADTHRTYNKAKGKGKNKIKGLCWKQIFIIEL